MHSVLNKALYFGGSFTIYYFWIKPFVTHSCKVGVTVSATQAMDKNPGFSVGRICSLENAALDAKRSSADMQ